MPEIWTPEQELHRLYGDGIKLVRALPYVNLIKGFSQDEINGMLRRDAGGIDSGLLMIGGNCDAAPAELEAAAAEAFVTHYSDLEEGRVRIYSAERGPMVLPDADGSSALRYLLCIIEADSPIQDFLRYTRFKELAPKLAGFQPLQAITFLSSLFNALTGNRTRVARFLPD